jgi:hypothetical protein
MKDLTHPYLEAFCVWHMWGQFEGHLVHNTFVIWTDHQKWKTNYGDVLVTGAVT